MVITTHQPLGRVLGLGTSAAVESLSLQRPIGRVRTYGLAREALLSHHQAHGKENISIFVKK